MAEGEAAMAEEANQLAAGGRLYSAIFYVFHSLQVNVNKILHI